LKTRKNVEIKENYYINFYLKDGLGTEFTACKADRWQRERWHHLPHATYIATLRFWHIYWAHKVGHAQNI